MRSENVITFLAVLLLFTGGTIADTGLSTEEAKGGFVSLFDGASLDAWRKPWPKEFRIRNGILVIENGGTQHLYTKKEYADFILRLDFRLGKGSSSGIGIRTPFVPLRPSCSGMEVQVLDDSYYPREIDGKMFHLKPWQYHGSIYGLVPAKPGHVKPLGEWNEEEIICRGRRVQVILNGTTIVDADLDSIPEENLRNQFGKGWQREKGHVVLCGYSSDGDNVEIRNIRIKELTRNARFEPQEIE
jgi:hypothetical protein